MKKFMDDTFLLSNELAINLFEKHAKNMPIIDYHCHLNPQEIADNKSFKNLTQIWLYGDHYKWRAMRANGIDEFYITGQATDYEKFMAWAKTVPMTIGNPLYNWTHLELQRYFGIYTVLNEDTAEEVWNRANELLQTDDFGVQQLIERFNVEVICTTDDPVDDLSHHERVAAQQHFKTKVLPSFRPDKVLNIHLSTFEDWIKSLEHVVGYSLSEFTSLLNALEERIQYFHDRGCRVSDHALDTVTYNEVTEDEAALIYKKAMHGDSLTTDEIVKYRTFLLLFLSKQYSSHDWAMQYHMKALRNTNERKLSLLGPDTGFDSINDGDIAQPLASLLNEMELQEILPKTILYSLNPNDNYVLGTMIGNYQGGQPGKIQFGTAWWFNDQKDGMLDQMKALANLGLFSQFIGMLTDSRSFLSYTRHEYFRRLVCDLVASWVENGEVPNDERLLGGIIENICYGNARNYFKFE
ncbi:glucuronate isomerase [Sporosarcina cascadiensis]|uniref:glucuronate isomerase n=1 Tax=Sporosarcina cascadiensis TaxID=2660747 RepID=UPI00129C0845|nr:glucuronate isomerase [Sporosarcina cascadiensis]